MEQVLDHYQLRHAIQHKAVTLNPLAHATNKHKPQTLEMTLANVLVRVLQIQFGTHQAGSIPDSQTRHNTYTLSPQLRIQKCILLLGKVCEKALGRICGIPVPTVLTNALIMWHYVVTQSVFTEHAADHHSCCVYEHALTQMHCTHARLRMCIC